MFCIAYCEEEREICPNRTLDPMPEYIFLGIHLIIPAVLNSIELSNMISFTIIHVAFDDESSIIGSLKEPLNNRKVLCRTRTKYFGMDVLPTDNSISSDLYIKATEWMHVEIKKDLMTE